MKSQTSAIGFLSITALILFIAQFIPVQPTQAAAAFKDRDYAVVAARSVQGGESGYIVDNRSGAMAVFTWNPGQRSFELGGSGNLADAFK